MIILCVLIVIAIGFNYRRFVQGKRGRGTFSIKRLNTKKSDKYSSSLDSPTATRKPADDTFVSATSASAEASTEEAHYGINYAEAGAPAAEAGAPAAEGEDATTGERVKKLRV